MRGWLVDNLRDSPTWHFIKVRILIKLCLSKFLFEDAGSESEHCRSNAEVRGIRRVTRKRKKSDVCLDANQARNANTRLQAVGDGRDSNPP